MAGGCVADRYQRQSPLAGLGLEASALASPPEAGVTACDRGFRGQLALRGDCSNRQFTSTVEQVLGAAVPTVAHTSSRGRGALILWLGPDEWLVVLPDGRQGKAIASLGESLSGVHHAVSDVSDSRGVIGLHGSSAREVLLKGCHLDLHPRRFGPGRCAQSGLARCHMLLHQLDDSPAYDLYIHRSLMAYVWAWLADAAREYGFAVASS